MTDRKMSEEAIRRANATLEKRVTERTAQLSFLSEASKLLGSTLDYEITLQELPNWPYLIWPTGVLSLLLKIA